MTAVNSGTATVTLQSVANPSKKATIEVHVTDDTRDDPVDPVDPVVSISSLEIKADGLDNGKMTLAFNCRPSSILQTHQT